MATPIQLRCRSRSAVHSIKDLDSHSTLVDLKAFILSLTGLEFDSFILKSGIPPTVINGDDNSLLSECGVNSGDLVIIEECKKSNVTTSQVAGKRPANSSNNTEISKKPSPDLSIKRKVVPANNSCLFSSIDYCVRGTLDINNASNIRRAVANTILSDPDTYNEAMLGRAPKEYADWVLNNKSWGGGIEISVLSQHYKMEIDVVDIQHTRIEKFGEQHDNRILLIYDGIHYDPLHEGSETRPRTIFPSHDDEVLARALCLAEKEKANRQFTDSRNFTLKCLVCGKGLAGDTQAMKHANETSHINFAEY